MCVCVCVRARVCVCACVRSPLVLQHVVYVTERETEIITKEIRYTCAYDREGERDSYERDYYCRR